MRFQPYPVLTVFTLASLALLVWLGSWQWGRYVEKLARRDAPEPSFTRMVHDIVPTPGVNAQQVYGLIDGAPVWRRYVPVRPADGGAPAIALFDVTLGPEPQPLALGKLGRLDRPSVAVRRPVRRNAFTPADRPDDDTWYAFDADAVAGRLGIDEADGVLTIEPRTLRLNGRQVDNPFALPAPPDPLPPERHFGYALTWWGLAAGLVGVYLVFHHSRGRLRFRASD